MKQAFIPLEGMAPAGQPKVIDLSDVTVNKNSQEKKELYVEDMSQKDNHPQR